ncbi:MAG: Flp family type IVb pilin [Alphaproteobacteria bacterium]|nr:Flp family type IVb pilin [Alphaproteobacteria bacterium]
MSKVQDFLKNSRGATAIEYALIAGMIALSIVAVVGLVGSNLTERFNSVLDSFK